MIKVIEIFIVLAFAAYLINLGTWLAKYYRDGGHELDRLNNYLKNR